MISVDERVTNEIMRILNHSGLNPDDELDVHTATSCCLHVSIVKGVDVAKARLALGVHMTGRDVQLRTINNTNTLVVIQPERQ